MRRIFETSRGRPELLNSALNKSNIILRSIIGKYFIYNLRGGRQPYTVEGLVEMPSNETTNTCRLVYLRSFDSFSPLKEENVSIFESNAHLSFMIKKLPRICCFSLQFKGLLPSRAEPHFILGTITTRLHFPADSVVC